MNSPSAITPVLLVAAGSALGGVLRYGVSLAMRGSAAFPWATLTVNVAGSLALGAVAGLCARGGTGTESVRLFAVVGVCGGFTTFSTFSNEAVKMLAAGQWGLLGLYVGATLVAGLAAVAAGYALAKGALAI